MLRQKWDYGSAGTRKNGVLAAFFYGLIKLSKIRTDIPSCCPLDYIPDLSDFVCWPPAQRERNGNGGPDVEQKEEPSKSGGTGVTYIKVGLTTPTISVSAASTARKLSTIREELYSLRKR
jgi:hypothetical protein